MFQCVADTDEMHKALSFFVSSLHDNVADSIIFGLLTSFTIRSEVFNSLPLLELPPHIAR